MNKTDAGFHFAKTKLTSNSDIRQMFASFNADPTSGAIELYIMLARSTAEIMQLMRGQRSADEIMALLRGTIDNWWSGLTEPF